MQRWSHPFPAVSFAASRLKHHCDTAAVAWLLAGRQSYAAGDHIFIMHAAWQIWCMWWLALAAFRPSEM